jgi:hypothetical protein
MESAKARTENFELELHLAQSRSDDPPAASFVNHAGIGVYRDAIRDFYHVKLRADDHRHPERTTSNTDSK